MKVIFSRFQVVSALYDFATEGGAVTTIDLDCIIPKNCIVVRSTIRTWVSAASGGAATISFDRVVGAVVTTGFYLPATPFANFVSTPGAEVLPGFDFNATPLLTSQAADSTIAVTIGGAALTTGRIQLIVQLQMTDELA